jgi:hypothetical protein
MKSTIHLNPSAKTTSMVDVRMLKPVVELVVKSRVVKVDQSRLKWHTPPNMKNSVAAMSNAKMREKT